MWSCWRPTSACPTRRWTYDRMLGSGNHSSSAVSHRGATARSSHSTGDCIIIRSSGSAFRNCPAWRSMTPFRTPSSHGLVSSSSWSMGMPGIPRVKSIIEWMRFAPRDWFAQRSALPRSPLLVMSAARLISSRPTSLASSPRSTARVSRSHRFPSQASHSFQTGTYRMVVPWSSTSRSALPVSCSSGVRWSDPPV